MDLFFSNAFDVSQDALDDYGAFNISLVTDLPLFIDPFLLFNSSKREYKQLHDEMIRYLRFLRDKSESGSVGRDLIQAWYCFSEVKQNWLGFCVTGNRGRGLGRDFANALNSNLARIFRDFGNETITRASHIEKLCLIGSGVGRDMISDFTTNLIKDYLLRYTQTFAQQHINPHLRRQRAVARAQFDYSLERWMPQTYDLPLLGNDYVILTPRDILTKDDTWISYTDLVAHFDEIPDAIPNAHLRAAIDNYFRSRLRRDREPSQKDIDRAITRTLEKFPQIIDYYIKMKEDRGDQATAISSRKVECSTILYVKQFGFLAQLLRHTAFYTLPENTTEETRQKIAFFKDIIENKGGHRIFYVSGEPIRKESDLHILFRLVWHGTPSDVSHEVNNGKGPADFKISRGTADKTIVEFKLASNPQLKRNLDKQTPIYQAASDASTAFKVIVYFTEREHSRVHAILEDLRMLDDPSVVLVDARNDNKPSGSKA